MKLAVGFITYNDSSAKYLSDFLPSLKRALDFLPKKDRQILAWDNSHSDFNINRLALEYFTQQNREAISIFSSEKNIGFGAAYNELIKKAKQAGATYFLTINPDVLLETDTIKKLFDKLELEPTLASVAPKILRWDFDKKSKTNQIDSCGLKLKNGLKFIDLGQGEIDNGQYDKADILGSSGAMGLFRMSSLDKVKGKFGYYDSRFFMYKEDCDLAYRLKLAGFKSSLVPWALAYHDRTAAFYGQGIWQFLANRRQASRLVRAWSFKNQHLLFVKHFKSEGLWSQLKIVFRVTSLLFFSLILEQFNLKEYPAVFKFLKY